MAAIYLIRHGQASFGNDDYDQLSELGVKQSRALGKLLNRRSVAFDLVVTGAMQRHIQTAQHCLGAMNAKPALETWEAFNEYNHHEVLVAHCPEFATSQGIAQWLAHQDNPRQAFQHAFEEALTRWRSGNFNGDYEETWGQFRQRCEEGLEAIRQQTTSFKSVAIFSSGGPIACAVGHSLKLSDDKVAELSWSLLNGSISCLLTSTNKLSLKYFNDISHLELGEDSRLLSYR